MSQIFDIGWIIHRYHCITHLICQNLSQMMDIFNFICLWTPAVFFSKFRHNHLFWGRFFRRDSSNMSTAIFLPPKMFILNIWHLIDRIIFFFFLKLQGSPFIFFLFFFKVIWFYLKEFQQYKSWIHWNDRHEVRCSKATAAAKLLSCFSSVRLCANP